MATKKKPKTDGASKEKPHSSLLARVESVPFMRTKARSTGFSPEEIDQRVELVLAYTAGKVTSQQITTALNIENVGQFVAQALYTGVRSGRWTLQRVESGK